MSLAINLVEGCEKHVRPETLEKLGDLSASAYAFLKARDPDLSDGAGNCWIVAAIVHGVAQAMGLKSRLYGGQTFQEDGTPRFASGGHYWTILEDALVADSPNADTIIVWPKACYPDRLVPLRTARPGNASMRGAKGLRPIVEAARKQASRHLQEDTA